MTMETLPVADIELPEELNRLRDLAYNLWWSWNPRARRLFASINAQLWSSYRNPVQLMINIEPHYWERIMGDGGAFISDYRKVIRDFDRYMAPKEATYFQQKFENYSGGPIAYFSTEFGLHESLGIYCGGLGVLSGDHTKAASDLGLPFYGIGILYRKGYFRQAIDPDGRQHHIFSDFDFYRLPLRPLRSTTGRGDLMISIEFPGRDVQARVWQLTVGRVQLFLLDTDIPENDPVDRPITSQLYVRGREMRLCQELVLGIGGVRVLKELKIEPEVWHMNEGHSAFLVVERLRVLMRAGQTWNQALEQIIASTVFTTHTPVPSGNEVFDMHLAGKYLQGYAQAMGVEVEQVLALGKSYPEGGGQPFNLTAVGIRSSRYANGVSKLHGQVSNQMWRHVFPDDEKEKEPVKYVTNGVHASTWLGHDIRTLVEDELGNDWQDHLCDVDFWQGIKNLDPAELWEAHGHQKDRLIRLVRNILLQQVARHGASPDEMRDVSGLMDPKALTIGFARRFATYKRAGLIFKDYNRLKSLVTHPDRPVQIIFSGKAHPADNQGQELVQNIYNTAAHSDIKDHIMFVEDYEMQVARHLVQGVDVWLNTPRRPREASGTSGMKAAMNGVLNFSISDGWWPEAYNENNGWLISGGREYDNEEMQDYEDSSSFYDILEHRVIPAYYENRQDGVPMTWIEMMKESMATIIPGFNAARMLTDYLHQAYLPVASE